MFRVAVLVGSPRASSSNLKLAKALEKLAAGKLEFHDVRIDNLPFLRRDAVGESAGGSAAAEARDRRGGWGAVRDAGV